MMSYCSILTDSIFKQCFSAEHKKVENRLESQGFDHRVQSAFHNIMLVPKKSSDTYWWNNDGKRLKVWSYLFTQHHPAAVPTNLTHDNLFSSFVCHIFNLILTTLLMSICFHDLPKSPQFIFRREQITPQVQAFNSQASNNTRLCLFVFPKCSLVTFV